MFSELLNIIHTTVENCKLHFGNNKTAKLSKYQIINKLLDKLFKYFLLFKISEVNYVQEGKHLLLRILFKTFKLLMFCSYTLHFDREKKTH